MTAGGSAGVARFPEVREGVCPQGVPRGGLESWGLARSQWPGGGTRSKGLQGWGGKGGDGWVALKVPLLE